MNLIAIKKIKIYKKNLKYVIIKTFISIENYRKKYFINKNNTNGVDI